MRRIIYFTAIVGIAFASWGLLHTLQSGPSSGDIVTLPSGPFGDAILIRNANIKDVSLYLIFPSGEAANPHDEGLAHYIEHLAWLSAFGASADPKARHSNAWTNHFTTGYYQVTEPPGLQATLRRLISVADPIVLDAQFAREERDIVLREYDFRIVGRPLYPVHRDMDRLLYGSGTFSRSVIGDPAIIATYALDTARAYHQESHALSEATLLVYGNVSAARMKNALAALPQSDARPAGSPSPDWVENAPLQDRAALEVASLGEDTLLYRKLVPLNACDSAARCALLVRIAQNALDSTLPGGLAGPLRYDQFIARSFAFDLIVLGDAYVEVIFTAHPDTGITLDTLEDAFQSTYRNTLESGLTAETFDRVASRIRGDFARVLGRDRPAYNRDLALDRLMLSQPVISLSEKERAMADIDLSDVNAFLRSLLVPGREVTRLIRTEG